MNNKFNNTRVVYYIAGFVTFLAALFGALADGNSVFEKFFSSKPDKDLSEKGILNTYESDDKISLVLIDAKQKNYSDIVSLSKEIINQGTSNSVILYYSITSNLQDKFLFYYDVTNSTYLERESFERKLLKEIRHDALGNKEWCFTNLMEVISNVFIRDLSETKAQTDIFLISDFDLCDSDLKEVEELLHRYNYNNLFLVNTQHSDKSYQGFFNDVSKELGHQKRVHFSINLPFLSE